MISDIRVYGLDLTVCYDYEPAERGYVSDYDGGAPDAPASVDIESVFLPEAPDVDLSDYLAPGVMQRIEDRLIDLHEG